jgi:hemerythrin-like domain-containing protein
MGPALEILSKEHQNILKMINALLRECDFLRSGAEINKDFFKKAISFVREYADRFHHAKEEDILFKELGEEEGRMHCSPIKQMLYEHNLGRNFIKKLEKEVEENNKEGIIENARGYARLLQEHIFKEDNILYPMADEVLGRDIKDDILYKFRQIEQRSSQEKEKQLLFLKKLKEHEGKNK